MLDAARTFASGMDAERIELLPGDIAEPLLGLDQEARGRLAREVRHVFHLAAIYNLAVPKTVAQRVNVGGTGNVLDFCRLSGGLERLVYVSTAYVAGKREGIVYEHELSLGQDFKNHYESTKFQAEVWVRSLMNRIPTTILRPAIVVGESVTGETDKFDGPYYILRSIALAERARRAITQFGAANATFNVMPVDFVVAAMVAAAHDPLTVGETLHLVDPEPLSTRELVRTMSREYAGREPRGTVPAGLVTNALRVPPIRAFFDDTPAESIAYLNHPVTFDARRAIELLTPHGLRPPRFPDYAGAMVRFFRENQSDPAFKPRPAG